MIPRRQIIPKVEPMTGFRQGEFTFEVGVPNVNAKSRNKPNSEVPMKYMEMMLRRVFDNLFKTDPLWL